MQNHALKVIFAGTPEFAATHLKAVLNSKHQVCAVYTQPDRPAGRGRKLTASPVKLVAEEHGITVYQPETLKSEEQQQLLASLNADLMIVVAYGIILPKVILKTPRLGCINVHASLLPRWRGAAPIQRAIESGDAKTGVTIMQMDEGLDTGDMLMTSSLFINDEDTSSSLHDKLMNQGSATLIEALDNLTNLQLTAIPQDNNKANYAKKLSKEEGAINWSESAKQIVRKIHAFNPWPGCFVTQNQQKLKILAVLSCETLPSTTQSPPGSIVHADKKGIEVVCGEGTILITSLQMPGKKMTPVTALLNAYQERFKPGQQFDK